MTIKKEKKGALISSSLLSEFALRVIKKENVPPESIFDGWTDAV